MGHLRLTKYIQTYSWARSAKAIPTVPSMLYCNIGKDETAAKRKYSNDSEGKLECEYVSQHSCEYDAICVMLIFPFSRS